MLSCYHAIFQSSRIRTKNRRSRLTALTLMWFLWDVKEPTPLLEKSRGRRPRCCRKPSHITSITPWVGWVHYAHKWTENGCQWRLCMLTSELTVHVLKCIVRGHVCCSLIHDSLSLFMLRRGSGRNLFHYFISSSA